jgi:hypothetical protein
MGIIIPKQQKIYHFKDAEVVGIDFEWHSVSKQMFAIHRMSTPVHGELIAENVPNHGAAWNLILMWCRGYKTRKRQEALRPDDKMPKKTLLVMP